MSDTKVNITYYNKFGFEGSSPSQLDYPSGICVADSALYIADKQNHRIQKFDFDGTFILAFGSVGSGNDNFFFPEDICTDGTYLYISDYANNRIKKHAFDGTFVSEITGLSYPCGIYFDTYVFVADRQNDRVAWFDTDLVFIDEITGLYLPRGVAYLNDQIIIADTGNNKIKIYSIAGVLQRELLIPCTSIRIVDGYIVAIDSQSSKLIFIDLNYNYSDQMFFPYSLAVNESQFYVTDAKHRVLIFDFLIETTVPSFAETLKRLAKQLYPTGRAWAMKEGGVLDKLHLAFAYSESRAYQTIIDIRNSLLPDNDNFNEDDAINWERALGLYQQPYLTMSERKIIIERKMNFPGLQKNRQHYKYIEGELRKVGFDVYLHENRFPDGFGGYTTIDPRSSFYDSFLYDEEVYDGSTIPGGYSILANHVLPEKDADFHIGTGINLRATFFIGGKNFGDRAVVPTNRLKEFREMVLKLKPAQTVAAFLLIDYIEEDGYLELESGGGVALENGTGFIYLESN